MGRYITTTGTAATVAREFSANASIEVNDRCLADTSGGAFTLTLPASGTLLVNDSVQFIDVTGSFGVNNLTVARNGAKIQNLDEDLLLDINNSAVTLIYTGSTYGWVISGT